MEPTGGRRRARRLGDEHARHAQRPDEHEHVRVEGDDVAELELAVEDEVAAVPEDGDEGERSAGSRRAAGRSRGGAPPAASGRARRRPRGRGGRDCSPSAPKPFTDAHAGDALLDHAREVAELLLQAEGHGLDLLREARRRHVEERQRAQREHGEHHVLQRHHDDDGDQDERARDRERDEDHDLVDLLDVAVRARHELAGLGLVVEREVQSLEVREQPLAQVGLGPVRDAERGVAAQTRTERLEHTDGEHDHHVHDDDLAVAGEDAVVDGVGGEQGDRDLGRGPHRSGRHAGHDPARLAAQRAAHEAPAGLPRLELVVHVPFPSGAPRGGSEVGRRLAGYQCDSRT